MNGWQIVPVSVCVFVLFTLLPSATAAHCRKRARRRDQQHFPSLHSQSELCFVVESRAISSFLSHSLRCLGCAINIVREREWSHLEGHEDKEAERLRGNVLVLP